MRLGRPPVAWVAIGLLGLAGCTAPSGNVHPTPGETATGPKADAGTSTGGPSSSASPSPGPTSTPASGRPSQTISEPTTTNTLPPPPRPSRPAPSTAGRLSASSLPVPDGWRKVVRAGSSEEGYRGNGTWVHARDPRYAARDVITLGCADVTRDDYTDPVAALEGTYERRPGAPGIGLVLQFSTRRAAEEFFALYKKQVAACTSPDGPVLTKVISTAGGLVDQRTYPDGDWTEVGALRGDRLTLVILTDPGHTISKSRAERLRRQITGS